MPSTFGLFVQEHGDLVLVGQLRGEVDNETVVERWLGKNERADIKGTQKRVDTVVTHHIKLRKCYLT